MINTESPTKITESPSFPQYSRAVCTIGSQIVLRLEIRAFKVEVCCTSGWKGHVRAPVPHGPSAHCQEAIEGSVKGEKGCGRKNVQRGRELLTPKKKR